MSAVAKYYKLTSKFLTDYNAEITTKLTEALNLNDDQVTKMHDALKVDDMIDLKKLRKGGAKSGATRAPTAYNLYVQSKIKELKAATPDMDRKELMVQAAAAWTLEKKNKLAAESSAASPKKKAKK